MQPADGETSPSREAQILQQVEITLRNVGAPTHDRDGRRLNANGMLVDWLAGERAPGWTGPDPMSAPATDAAIDRAARSWPDDIGSLLEERPLSHRERRRVTETILRAAQPAPANPSQPGARPDDGTVEVCALAVGDEFFDDRTHWQVTYRDHSHVKATGQQFGNVRSYVDPAVRPGDFSWNRRVCRFRPADA